MPESMPGSVKSKIDVSSIELRSAEDRRYRYASKARASKTFTTRIMRFRSLERVLDRPEDPVAAGLLLSSSKSGIGSYFGGVIHGSEHDQADIFYAETVVFQDEECRNKAPMTNEAPRQESGDRVERSVRMEDNKWAGNFSIDIPAIFNTATVSFRPTQAAHWERRFRSAVASVGWLLEVQYSHAPIA